MLHRSSRLPAISLQTLFMNASPGSSGENEELGLSNGNYIAVADDHGDEELLKHAAFAFKPADAVVKSGIRLATPGGHGVMAELADRITVKLVGHDRDVMFDGLGIGESHLDIMQDEKFYNVLCQDVLQKFDEECVYATLLELIEATNKHSDETGAGEKIKRAYLGLDDAPLPNYAKGGIAHTEPDPHDFLANAATAKTCKATAEQLAKRARQEVHALKNLAVLEGDETADKKAGRIYDLIDQIVACGVSEKRYGNSFIPDPNAQPLDLAAVTEIAQLRKENAELKEWCDKLNECCNSLESEVQMLKAKVYDIQIKQQ